MQSKTLGELSEYVNGRVHGNPNVKIHSAATLGKATEGDISFLANLKYEKQLKTTKASAVVVGKDITNAPVPLLIAKDPYYAFMQIMVLLHGHRKHKKVGISRRAKISDSAKIGVDCHIHDFVTIYPKVIIEDSVEIFEGAILGKPPIASRALARKVSSEFKTTIIGRESAISPHAVIYSDVKIGEGTLIGDNASIR